MASLYPHGERSWGDVDILLPPSGMDRALEVLLASGFSHRDPGLRWRTSEDHALTLWHDPDGKATHGAAAEVDVHHRFEGMEADPERVFAELWRRREPAQLGGLEVWFPDLASRSLILVLNAARDPKGPKAPEDLRRLVAVASDADWRRTIALGRRVDALQALRAGIEVEPDGHDLVARTSLADVEVSAAWRLRAQGSSRTAVRIEELRSLGAVARIRTVAAWIVPSPAVIRYRDPRAAEGRWLLLRAYAARYREGAAGLRQSTREILAQRRQQREGRPESGHEGEPEAIPLQGPPPAAASADAVAAPDSTVVRVGTGHLTARATAVARSDGSVALLCGEPGAGTSTLAAALVERGCTSLSDGTTLLDPDTLDVLPIPGPVSLVPADELSTIDPSSEPLESRLLVFVEHDPHATGTSVEVVPGGEAAYLMGSRSAELDDVTGGALPVLARLARRVPAYRLQYDDAARGAEEVLRLWPTP